MMFWVWRASWYLVFSAPPSSELHKAFKSVCGCTVKDMTKATGLITYLFIIIITAG